MKNIITGLKMVIKYGALIGVIINVIQYAIEQLEPYTNKDYVPPTKTQK